MEREIERAREREPIEMDYAFHETKFIAREKELSRVASLPHVLKYDKFPWGQTQMAYDKKFVCDIMLDKQANNAPIYTIAALEQVIPPGAASGRHRHFVEAMFYVCEGKGWEIHDGQKYPWEAGDLFLVPTYAIHQHNTDPTTSARLFFVIPVPFTAMGLGHQILEFHEWNARFRMPPTAEPIRDSQGRLIGYRRQDGAEVKHVYEAPALKDALETKWRAPETKVTVKNHYDEYIAKWHKEAQWRRTCPHIIKGSQQPWENTRMGRIKYLLAPHINSGTVTFDSYIQELPPEGRSGKHRHATEEVIKVIKGRGHDVHDGTRWDWEAEDVICIPMFATHQHFNDDPKEPAQFLSIQSRFYSFVEHGGVEHLEDAPGYSH